MFLSRAVCPAAFDQYSYFFSDWQLPPVISRSSRAYRACGASKEARVNAGQFLQTTGRASQQRTEVDRSRTQIECALLRSFCGVREQRIRFYPSPRRTRFSGVLPRRAVSINTPNRISRIGIKTAQLRRHRSCTAHAVLRNFVPRWNHQEICRVRAFPNCGRTPAIRPVAMIQSTSGKSR